jgi:aspartate aminotransferase-like enzyme
MATVSREAMEKAREIAERMTYFDLMNHAKYMDAFIQANFLPHTDLARFPSVAGRPGRPAAQEAAR